MSMKQSGRSRPSNWSAKARGKEATPSGWRPGKKDPETRNRSGGESLAGMADEKWHSIEGMDRPLPLMLDKEMSDVVREYLEGKGLRIRTGVKVEN